MARLVLNDPQLGNRVISLNLGVNRLGRGPDNDFRIDDPTISSSHCELVLGDDGIIVRDRASANGTFVNGEAVQETKLAVGQSLRLGSVELLVETTDVTVAIPRFDIPRPAPPVVLADGSLLCPRHPNARATHQCTHCREVLCDACVHYLRRHGGRLMKFCPLCSHPCEPLGGEKKKKRSLFTLLHRTVALPFLHPSKSKEPE